MQSFIRKTGFFTAFILPALTVLGYYAGGYWNYTCVAFAFVLLPLFDQLLGINTANVPAHEVKAVESDFYYRFVTYCWTYIQIGFVLWAMYVATQGIFNKTIIAFGFILSSAIVTGGIGITVAHELGHKQDLIERFYSKLLLMTVCYMHFYIEHNRGHHVLVGTPEDPATAKKNESVYAFWYRSVVYGYLHAWKLVNESLQRKGKSAFSIYNEMIWFAILPILFCAVVTLALSIWLNRFTWEVPVYFFAQSVLAFTLLELVNYVEHYGIERKKLETGRYERINPQHSWNASHILSNFFLFQLQRHSDHHVFTYKRYQILDHYDESPQLPFGYSTMIIIALVPPVWFKMMNTRLEDWKIQNSTFKM